MISREDFLAEVRDIEPQYEPSPAVAEQLGSIDLTLVVGPMGMGEDTVIRASGLHDVVAETIREPRLNSGVMEQNGREYLFRAHELDVILGGLRQGEYVQMGMGPNRDSFYGSRIDAYPSEGPAVMDVMSSQVDGLRDLPFASVEAVFIVAPDYESWLARLSKRGVIDLEWERRKPEAQRSLEEALSDDQYAFVVNDEIKRAAEMLRRVAARQVIHEAENDRGRTIATEILEQI